MELILLSELLELLLTALFWYFIKNNPLLGDKMDVQFAFSSDESTVIRVPQIRITRIWISLPWKFPLAVGNSSRIIIICLSSSQLMIKLSLGWMNWLWFYILGGFTLFTTVPLNGCLILFTTVPLNGCMLLFIFLFSKLFRVPLWVENNTQWM